MDNLGERCEIRRTATGRRKRSDGQLRAVRYRVQAAWPRRGERESLFARRGVAQRLGVHLSSAAIENPNRRDFLYIATAAVGAVGAAAVVWPLIDQMNPDASTLALSSIEVDLAPIAEGQIVTVKWRGGPVFIRHRTKKEIDEAANTPLADLKDPQTDAGARQEAGVADRQRRLHASRLRAARPRGPVRGLEVPVPRLGLRHLRAAFGRARRRRNLPVPEYAFLSDTRVKIG